MSKHQSHKPTSTLSQQTRILCVLRGKCSVFVNGVWWQNFRKALRMLRSEDFSSPKNLYKNIRIAPLKDVDEIHAATVISAPFNERISPRRWTQPHAASTMLRRVFENRTNNNENLPHKDGLLPRHAACRRIKQTAGARRKLFTELFQPVRIETHFVFQFSLKRHNK